MSTSPPPPPPTATAVAAASTTAAAQQQQQHTYWCHECDMSVFLHLYPPPPPTHPRCPHCHSDFLEQMDSFTPLISQDPHLLIPFLDPTTTTTATTAFTPSDDNFLLDSPYLHRLIHHLTTTNDHFAPTPNTTTSTTNRASKSALESLQDIKIDSSMLENDPVIPCPVCKDQFLLNMEVKMLPCKHMYHKDCIFPWLEMNNSCPVCRFRLPTQEDEDCDQMGGLDNRGESFIGGMRLEELVDDEHDFFGFGRTLRRIARRHQLAGESASGGDSLEFLLSPTQIGEAGGGVGVVARANSMETVSSWPSWPVESGSEGEVGGSGNRIGGEGDTVVRS